MRQSSSLTIKAADLKAGLGQKLPGNAIAKVLRHLVEIEEKKEITSSGKLNLKIV